MGAQADLWVRYLYGISLDGGFCAFFWGGVLGFAVGDADCLWDK